MLPVIAGIAAALIAVSLVWLIAALLRKKRKRRSAGNIPAQTVQSIHSDRTELMDDGVQDIPSGVCALRYIGPGGWPESIYINISENESFSIGRFDVVLGQSVSSYEFPADSQAVSRRHAVILRDEEGYIIQDQGSKAGTFVNGVKLETGKFYRLKNRYQISFGTAGADYLWEEIPSAVGAGVMREEA